ncbi:MAG: flavin-containing monooxygenase [Mycobacterium sp.]
MSEHFDVLIIGAGLSGISAAWHVQNRCPSKSYAVLEARDDMGGTWNLFKYPGIRSDSDMYTLGFRFSPWNDSRTLADGPSILDYVHKTAANSGIDGHIKYRHKMVGAAWSNEDQRWTITVEHDGETVEYTSSFLFGCSGYYNYDEGYSPEFPGSADFQGQIVHPQHWPEDLDYKGKKVVVIGSGATAVTLVPAMAPDTAHITMLQRSPTYILSLPNENPIINGLRKVLPEKVAYPVARWMNIGQLIFSYQASRKFPRAARQLIMQQAKLQLPKGYDYKKHFGPKYNPWDERLCVVPNGDLYKTIRNGKADIVTDQIETFDETGIKLKSGKHLDADIIITATGLNLQFFGGIIPSVDGVPADLRSLTVYKGAMLTGIPNMAFTIGYTNASWTLKADLVSEYVCRLLNYMDENGYTTTVPELLDPTVEPLPFMEFTPGYVLRALEELPRQGSKHPWRLKQNYAYDIGMMRRSRVTEGMRFGKKKASAPSSSSEPVAVNS